MNNGAPKVLFDIAGGDAPKSELLAAALKARQTLEADILTTEGIDEGLSRLAQGEGDAFVSAGSTGELILTAREKLGLLPNIRRAALAVILPTLKKPCVLIDAGASTSCTPEILLEFSRMGKEYADKILGIKNPRVGLLNIGTEPEKGDSIHRGAYELMAASKSNFLGNIEAREIPFGGCDVVVSDGFSGNIFLKAYEGTALAMLKSVSSIYKKSLCSRLSGLIVKKGFTSLKEKMDYNSHGGAPILGINGVVIKAHGASNSGAFFAALGQAVRMVENEIVSILE